MTLGCGQGGTCCGACQGANPGRPAAFLTPPLTFDGWRGSDYPARLAGPPVAVEAGAKAVDAFFPGVGTAIEQAIFAEVRPIPTPTVGQVQMQRVVDQLAAQGLEVPSSISGLPEDPSLFAAFGEQHKTLVMGAFALLGVLVLFKH